MPGPWIEHGTSRIRNVTLQSVALPAELSRLVATDQHALVAVNTYLSRIQEDKMRSTPILV